MAEHVPAEGERLSKRVAALRGCSRREAEWLIEGGWVRVDGQTVEAPQTRVGAQTVEIDRDARVEPPVPVTLLWCASADDARAPAPSPENRSVEDRSGIRPLRRHFTQLHEVLPMEPGAGGLVVLTQDERVLRRVTDPRTPVEQEYVVEVQDVIDDDALDRLARAAQAESRGGVQLRVSHQSERRLRLAHKGLGAGRITALCLGAGLAPVLIRRLRIGRVPLAGLPPGQWRYLPAHHRF